MREFSLTLADTEATVALGGKLADIIRHHNLAIIAHLNGDLGAGKTTLTRGFVQGMGHQGHVKSPTYTLVEPYELGEWQVYHFDLYRLGDPEELEYMGIRDYFNEKSCAFIEWPEKGYGILPIADLVINLAYSEEHRCVVLLAETSKGQQILSLLAEQLAG